MVGRELASRFFKDRTRPRTTVRPSVRTLTMNVLRPVVRMRTTQVPHRRPGVHPTSTSRDVSDQAFPASLAIFLRVISFPLPLPRAHAQSGKNGLVHETTSYTTYVRIKWRQLFRLQVRSKRSQHGDSCFACTISGSQSRGPYKAVLF